MIRCSPPFWLCNLSLFLFKLSFSYSIFLPHNFIRFLFQLLVYLCIKKKSIFSRTKFIIVPETFDFSNVCELAKKVDCKKENTHSMSITKRKHSISKWKQSTMLVKSIRIKQGLRCKLCVCVYLCQDFSFVCQNSLPWKMAAVETLSPYLNPSHPKVSGYHSHLRTEQSTYHWTPLFLFRFGLATPKLYRITNNAIQITSIQKLACNIL